MKKRVSLFKEYEREDPTNWHESNEVFWSKYLDSFETEIYPMFERRGYSKDTALNVLFAINTRSLLIDIRNSLRDNDD